MRLADTTYYALSACIYGDGGHFVELAEVVRDFTSNRLLFCDGMTNNAKYKGSAGKFPLNHMKQRLEKAYFVRSKYANLANKKR